jgi:uncharacterized protein (TIGR01319 family)
VREVTSRSAERVALGAGAILLDVIAMDDGRTPYEKIEALRQLRPDMILLAGGFDGDAISGPVFLGELIREAALRPKRSPTARLAVVYAGNTNACDYAHETLGEGFLFHVVPNLRPASDHENLEPAREAIHELFMEHVMSQAPGYEGLRAWMSSPVLPTPAAFGKILALASRRMAGRILAIDIGGATTDVFTAERGVVARTVSANLGMSYSILNVAQRCGAEAILALFDATGGRPAPDVLEFWDTIGAKHLQPTRLPVTPLQREVERATGTLAIREAVKDHLQVLRGIALSRGKDELHIDRFGPKPKRKLAASGPFALEGYDLVIGSGGILSHSPRAVAARMLVDALNPRKPVELAVDRAFMFPHLGALSEVDAELAATLFDELALVRLGSASAKRRDALVIAAEEGIEAIAGVAPEEVAGAASPAADVLLEPPQRERLELRRELAIPGEVFVKPGDRVASGTSVARSTRHFLRPFFLDVTAALGVHGRTATAHILKREGDEIETGEILAERRVNPLHTKRYLSPVSGRVERILPSGTLVVRERPESATQLTVVQVARDLQVSPEGIRPHVRVVVGQVVDRDQWLASSQRPGVPLRVSRSPVRGRVREINANYGVITLEPHLETLQVNAWLPGTVESVSDRGCIVTGEGVRIEGVWGSGGEVAGRLQLEVAQAGEILARDGVTCAELEQFAERGIAGLITGSLHLGDLLAQPPAFTLLLTEGFGARPMRPELSASLRAHAGRLTMLDGRTEMRVGVRRPFAILAEE